MSCFSQLVDNLRQNQTETFVWMLSAVVGADGISGVLNQIKHEVPECAEMCNVPLGLPRAELEREHERSFKLFSTRAALSDYIDLRAEAVAALTPREEAQKRHRQFLLDRAKRKAQVK